ncbi:MAG: type IV toxin-antitoxin system AbiEi family antitoxin domain-containing protein [Planctomycetota bacterium]
MLESIGNEPVFTSSLLMTEGQSRADIQLQLSRWVKAGKIEQLRRGCYMLSAPYRKIDPHPFFIAGKLKKASYISLQSALSYYGMIPEYVPVVTSVTTGRPETINTPGESFSFKHIKTSFFCNYQNIELSKKQTVFIATPEKSLLDLIYLTPGSNSADYIKELRLQNMERLKFNEMQKIADNAKSPKLKSAVKTIHKLAWEEEYKEL